jgi:hypothetical protein
LRHWKWQQLSESTFVLLMTSESVGNAWNEAEPIQLPGNFGSFRDHLGIVYLNV